MVAFLGTDADDIEADDYTYMRGLGGADRLGSNSPSFSRIEGNLGNDYLVFLDGAFGSLDGGAGYDNLRGGNSPGGDRLDGGDDDDWLRGYDGPDVLDGG